MGRKRKRGGPIRPIDKDVYRARIVQKCDSLGIKFLGFSSDSEGVNSRDFTLLSCSRGHKPHAYQIKINQFLSSRCKSGCMECKKNSCRGISNKMTDAEVNCYLMATGFFPEGTVFKYHSNQINNSKSRIFEVTCPFCSDDIFSRSYVGPSSFLAKYSHLIRGVKPCRCSRSYRWTESEIRFNIDAKCELNKYIFQGFEGDYKKTSSKLKLSCPNGHMFIKNYSQFIHLGELCPKCTRKEIKQLYLCAVKDNGVDIALKFGITSNVKSRMTKYKSSNKMLDFEIISTYEYSDDFSCRYTEYRIKKSFECQYLSSENMPDGHTETACLSDLNDIVSLIEESNYLFKEIHNESY